MKIAALATLLLASVALAAAGVSLTPSTRFEFTDCASGGSSAQTVTAGTYLLRVTDENTFICYAATCAAGGEKFPMGTVMLLAFGGSQSVSCRSSASSGDVILTLGQ